MLDHVIVNVADHDACKAFYLKALEPLGLEVVMEFEGFGTGFGAEGKPWFWVARRDPPANGSVHVAFRAPDRATVDRFHEAALAAGGDDHGEPGLRPHYHEHYYGAFVLDPEGNNIEAVSHRPE